MRTYKCEAIVISSCNFSDTDKLITLLPRNSGKSKVLVKGARKILSRKGPYLDLFSHNIFNLAHGRNFPILTDLTPLDGGHHKTDSLTQAAQRFYLSEVIDKSVREDQHYPALFDLLLSTLESGSEFSLRHFELSLVSMIGYSPVIQTCVICRSSTQDNITAFSFQHGGVVCVNCCGDCKKITPGTLRALRFLSNGEVFDPEMDVDDMANLQYILQTYLQYVLERKLKSVEFLSEVSLNSEHVIPAKAGIQSPELMNLDSQSSWE